MPPALSEQHPGASSAFRSATGPSKPHFSAIRQRRFPPHALQSPAWQQLLPILLRLSSSIRLAAMSAILSADDLNDFISPSVACIKPVETLPDPPPQNAYEVTTEGKDVQEARTAQISLTDCLACSGCVTSAEAVLVSMQSHAEVLSALDSAPAYPLDQLRDEAISDALQTDGKIFIASVSPQVRASLAATYATTEKEAGAMIEQLLCGPSGLSTGGRYGNKFTWMLDTNVFRDIALAMSVEELRTASTNAPTAGTEHDINSPPKGPVLTSACPGWICYAEKGHPYVLPHLSKVKSPQALAGTLLKSVLARHYGVDPAQVWHLAVMPCFDKKLEASRQELMDASWAQTSAPGAPIRDVDCVVTAREILMLADSRGLSFPSLPRTKPELQFRVPFPDSQIDKFLFKSPTLSWAQEPAAGTSGGYLYQVLRVQRDLHPGSTITIERGRNTDVAEYSLVHNGETLFKGARYYGFRNIQNLVRKFKPSKMAKTLPGGKAITARRQNKTQSRGLDHAYVEVMACPGGCTNGGGQIKVSDLSDLQSPVNKDISQKEWLSKVDEAYYSMDSEDEALRDEHKVKRLTSSELLERATALVAHWSGLTGIAKAKLVYTTYRRVESDVGKDKPDVEKVALLAGKIGGGW